MTFAASRGTESELLLRADTARFEPASKLARLEGVHVSIASARKGAGFEMRCERGELDLASSDFLASGSVRGRTDDGREFTTDWVRYDHEQGVLLTDAPVLIRDGAGTYQGGGFRYRVEDQHFRLIGGAKLVQEP